MCPRQSVLERIEGKVYLDAFKAKHPWTSSADTVDASTDPEDAIAV